MLNRLFVLIFLLVSASGYGQCTLNVSISASNTSICSGNKVLLTANASGGAGSLAYVWNTGESTQSINVNKAGTYTVTVTDQTPGCPGVQQSINISVGTSPAAPTVTGNTLVCPGTSATLQATGPGGTYQWYDAPIGGNFLFTGDTYTTPPINSGITFYVQTTINGCPSLRTGVFCNATGNPVANDVQTCSGTSTVLTATGGSNYQWFDAQTGGTMVGTGANFTTPVLTATTTYYVQATINGCLSARTPVHAIVTPSPQVPVASNVTICSGSTASLHATPGPGIFAWYDVPSGGTALILSPDYTTPPLTANKTYYVQNIRNGCESARTRVEVTVNQIPAAPGDQTQTICKGSSVLLTASASPPASGNYEWYTSATGTTPVATGLTYQTPVLSTNTNYYVLLNNGGCSSVRSKISVIISPPPAAPSVAGAIICNGSSTTLTATGPGGTYSWYNVATGGTPLYTGSTFTTPALTATTKYYVETNVSGCISPRKLVIVTVNAVVSPPTAANVTTCSGSPATVVASGGGSYAWYSVQTGGTPVATTQAFTTPPLTANTTYYVERTVNGCISARTSVTVSINPVPAAPSVSGNLNVCSGSGTTLTASGPAGSTFQWFDAATGGNQVKAGTTFTTPALTANTTYYVQSTLGGCISARTAVNITITSPAEPQFIYPSGSVCQSDPGSPTPTINNTSGGTFSATPAGLDIDPASGKINPGNSAPGTYTITFAGNGTCVTAESVSFKIFTAANASFTYNAAYCQDAKNPKPNFGGVGSAGTFTASPAGLVFANSSTGEIDLKKSTPGTYTITNTISAAGTCSGDSKTATVTIDQGVTISAGADQTVAAGTPVQLAGKVSGVPKGTWSGGTGTFSDKTIPNPVYTPGAGETSATLTYTSDDPTGSCLAKSDKVVIAFKNTLPKPTVTGTSTCSGSAANLSAIAPGGTYQWYDVATGGTLLHTGANFTTPILTANTTYYVETVNAAGVASPRTQVDVTVNAIPAAPVVPVTPVCVGNNITLTPNDQTGTFEWFDAATGGTLLAKTSTYTTPALTVNQTYFVQQTINGCTGPMAQVDVTVIPLAAVTSSSAGSVCSGNPLNYTITASVPAATFSWSRAAINGISNPAATGQAANPITETLINTSRNAIDVKYIITPINNGCPGTPFTYIVTVYPTPAVTSAAKPPAICNKAPVNYVITFNTAADFDWSRAAVPGISNAAVSGQNTATIRETLINTTNAPVDVVYVINSRTATCAGTPFQVTVTVNPTVRITSPQTGVACSNVPQNYVITSNIPTATYVWSRSAEGSPGISNPPLSGQTSSTITETLINTLPIPTHAVYKIQAMANGCPADSALFYVVIVNPQPVKPVANSNSPICIGSTIQLKTEDVANGSFLWTGPNGFSSTDQNPNIPNATMANIGDYHLVVTVNGCSSEVSTASVVVRSPGVANAGPDQIICITDPEIKLAGKVTGGTGQGIWSSTSATPGKFSSLTDLNAHYTPTQQERDAAKVTFVLTTTSDDDCAISTDTVVVNFGPLPAVNAGPDQSVCSQSPVIQLHGIPLVSGTRGSWTTTGTGNFSSVTDYNAQYFSSAADAASGSVKLVLHVVKNGPCEIETDTVKINFIPPPTVATEKLRYVLKDRTITLHPNISSDSVTYLWTPNINIEDNTVKNPVITGVDDITYKLTVTDSRGCISSDTTMVKVAPKLVVPNTFTPNNDGINDFWNITGLIAYTDAVVDIYTRYGQKVYHSIGYDKPWDGIFNGKQLPTGVYYYVIDTKLFNQVLSGSLTLLR
ncbi:MAG: PKD-like domain-containing protein [Mucilaginibacter sp.]